MYLPRATSAGPAAHATPTEKATKQVTNRSWHTTHLLTRSLADGSIPPRVDLEPANAPRWADLPCPAGAAVARPGAGLLVAAARAVAWTAILRGALPTAMVAVTVRRPRSTTETSLEPSLVT